MALPDYQFIHYLSQLPFVEKIFLFGSRARNDHRERSDIDIALFSPSASNNDWLKVMEIIDNADTLLKIDCVRLDRADIELQNKIFQEGIILYEKK